MRVGGLKGKKKKKGRKSQRDNNEPMANNNPLAVNFIINIINRLINKRIKCFLILITVFNFILG